MHIYKLAKLAIGVNNIVVENVDYDEEEPKKELLEVGKIIVTDDLGCEIPMYDLERSICDAFRSRNSIEAQDFNSILKSYVRRADKNLNLLMEYAKLFRVDNVARRYLEVLL